jgi:hypothetical protein
MVLLRVGKGNSTSTAALPNVNCAFLHVVTLQRCPEMPMGNSGSHVLWVLTGWALPGKWISQLAITLGYLLAELWYLLGLRALNLVPTAIKDPKVIKSRSRQSRACWSFLFEM